MKELQPWWKRARVTLFFQWPSEYSLLRWGEMKRKVVYQLLVLDMKCPFYVSSSQAFNYKSKSLFPDGGRNTHFLYNFLICLLFIGIEKMIKRQTFYEIDCWCQGGRPFWGIAFVQADPYAGSQQLPMSPNYWKSQWDFDGPLALYECGHFYDISCRA